MVSPLAAATERLTEDDGLSEAEYLSDVSKRDRRWDQRRVSGEIVEEIFRDFEHPTFAKWSPRLNQCSQVLEFGWSPDPRPDCDGVMSLKLKRSWFCKVPLCPVCMWRKSLMKLARLYSALPDLLDSYPRHRWLFLTFTVKNVEVHGLRDELKSIHKAFRLLTLRKEWKRSFVGWLRTTEITKGQDTAMAAHPHIHVLALVKSSYFNRNYVKHDEWIQLWRSCAGLDYDPSVDVKAVKPKKGQGDSGLRGAIAETAKYALKPADITLENTEYFRVLASEIRKIRMMAPGGVLREHMKDSRDETQQELILGDGDGEASEKNPGGVHYTWRPPQKRYVYDGRFHES